MAVALVVAAGRGERLGSEGPKAFVMLAGRPMIEWSIVALQAVAAIEQIVVALPPGVTAPAGTLGVTGGAQRSHSVRAALGAARAGDGVVLVHDAARPLLTPAIVEDCLQALRAGDCDAAIAAAPVVDTIKESAGQEVVRTLDRSRLWAVQTPQAFRRDVLERALAQDDDVLAAATDDASLVEALGATVRLVPAPAENLKVTTPIDLRVAELLLGRR
ncbi:MAG: 2-C-methyl-D-erythritol 4-phosphate cytidylyltransferase [Solirubrobacteraceae bacterium]|jgi:2-C-methyl-D-erythritol 4-phosphate cytidylyltransferase|nr:2-C-methyl-D-erythritol 4-phosphate cytidylyltransferase [Solirubrobacteraceae bacterium]MEA2276177.1 2-C-methyl-D-erythritol 4-phosphate cytidylyltransferase [Solirubrobacteraceae bacterium]